MSSKTATKQKFFKVTLKGNPITGFRDKDGVIHIKRPLVNHYHPPHNARYTMAGDRQVSPGWYTEEDLELFGLNAEVVMEQGWMRQKRPSLNVRADNYRSCYIEAESAPHAKDRFRKLFKIRDTPTSGFTAEPAPSSVTRQAPVDPTKKRKPKTQDDPWADID